MKQYYLLEQGQKRGSFSLEELKSFGISPTTYIWTTGMEDWQKVGNLEELSELLQETPPPIPSMPKTYLFEAILTTIFCCLPLGVAGIAYALKVSDMYKMGDYVQAEYNSNQALDCICFAIASAVLITLFFTMVILIVSFSNYGYNNNLFDPLIQIKN